MLDILQGKYFVHTCDLKTTTLKYVWILGSGLWNIQKLSSNKQLRKYNKHLPKHNTENKKNKKYKPTILTAFVYTIANCTHLFSSSNIEEMLVAKWSAMILARESRMLMVLSQTSNRQEQS